MVCIIASIQCVTNSVDTKNFEIAEINNLKPSRTTPVTGWNENEQGNATLILTQCDTWVLPIYGHKKYLVFTLSNSFICVNVSS